MPLYTSDTGPRHASVISFFNLKVLQAQFPTLLPSLQVSLLQVKKPCWATWLACMGSKALTAGVLAPNSRDTQEDPDAEPGA